MTKGDTMFHRVKEVQPLPAYNFLVSFVTGEQKYSVASLFEKWDVFKTLFCMRGQNTRRGYHGSLD